MELNIIYWSTMLNDCMWLCLNETLLIKTASGAYLALWVAGYTDPQRNAME
jgi:hypothetical protein